MTSRRFAPLFWCQFLSAFNDNFVRQTLVLLILFKFGAVDVGAKVSLAVAVLILPAIPLSTLGGEIADAHDKALIARRLKIAELFVQLIAAAGFYFSSLTLLYFALFGLGCIAALFGPVKYGILPDHLAKDELVAGNALVEGATFAAIICGLVLGGFAAGEGRAPWTVVLQLAVIALACYLTARQIPPSGVGAPNLKVNYNPLTAVPAVLGELRQDDKSWVGAIAVSWFWMVGAVTLSLVPVIIKSRIHGGIEVETAINLLFAVGIAIGSYAAAAIAHGQIRLAPTPFMLIVIGLISIDLGLSTAGMTRADAEVGLAEFFSSAIGVRIAIELLVDSFAAGLFVVPIFTAVQAWSGEDRRARVVGAVNTMNAIYMVGGSLLTTLALKLGGMEETTALVWLGIANLFAAVYFFARLPVDFRRLAATAFGRVRS